MNGNGVVDEHFLRRYRELLDAEEAAFDELEHSLEDGDRINYEAGLVDWRKAMAHRQRFLSRHSDETQLV